MWRGWNQATPGVYFLEIECTSSRESGDENFGVAGTRLVSFARGVCPTFSASSRRRAPKTSRLVHLEVVPKKL
jgi:hypothetical protein